jgi:hypothetical protein
LWGAILAAIRAIQVRFNMPTVNNQIPDVRNPRERIRKNEYRIPFVEKRIGQKDQRTREAQPPKSSRHHDPFQLLRRVPLNEEAAEEHGIANHADYLPYIPFDPEKLSVVPN